MRAEEVRKLNWVKVKNWSDITQTEYGRFNKKFIGEQDINSFVENIFRDIARRLDIPLKELLPILKEENQPFYKIKKNIYNKFAGLEIKDKEFSELKSLLRIPDISFLDKQQPTVNSILEDFSKLSYEDKEKVVDAINFEFERNFEVDAKQLIKDFNNLSDVEKFELMKLLGLLDIKVERIPN